MALNKAFAQQFKTIFHVLRERRECRNCLSFCRMREFQALSVQGLPWHPLRIFRVAVELRVELVPHQWVTDVSHVDPYLMGASGIELEPKKAVSPYISAVFRVEGLKRPVVRD